MQRCSKEGCGREFPGHYSEYCLDHDPERNKGQEKPDKEVSIEKDKAYFDAVEDARFDASKKDISSDRKGIEEQAELYRKIEERNVRKQAQELEK